MKKKIFVLIAAVLCLTLLCFATLVACGGDEKDKQPDEPGITDNDNPNPQNPNPQNPQNPDTTVDVADLFLNEESITIKVGATFTLVPEILPENATNKTVTWTCDDTSIATVNNGVVTGVAVGETFVTAHVGNLYRECEVTVKSASEEVDDVTWTNSLANFEGTVLSFAMRMVVGSEEHRINFDDNELYLGFTDETDPEQKVYYHDNRNDSHDFPAVFMKNTHPRKQPGDPDIIRLQIEPAEWDTAWNYYCLDAPRSIVSSIGGSMGKFEYDTSDDSYHLTEAIVGASAYDLLEGFTVTFVNGELVGMEGTIAPHVQDQNIEIEFSLSDFNDTHVEIPDASRQNALGVTFAEDEISVETGETIELTATVDPYWITEQIVYFKIEDEGQRGLVEMGEMYSDVLGEFKLPVQIKNDAGVVRVTVETNNSWRDYCTITISEVCHHTQLLNDIAENGSKSAYYTARDEQIECRNYPDSQYPAVQHEGVLAHWKCNICNKCFVDWDKDGKLSDWERYEVVDWEYSDDHTNQNCTTLTYDYSKELKYDESEIYTTHKYITNYWKEVSTKSLSSKDYRLRFNGGLVAREANNYIGGSAYMYRCEVCMKVFADPFGHVEITGENYSDYITSPTCAHDYDDQGICRVCHLPKPTPGLEYKMVTMANKDNNMEVTPKEKALRERMDTDYYVVTGIDWEAVGGAMNEEFFSLVIPSEHNGLPVKAIGNEAFSEENHIKWVYIPDGVEYLETDCLTGCHWLEEITLPRTLHGLYSSHFSTSGSGTVVYAMQQVFDRKNGFKYVWYEGTWTDFEINYDEDPGYTPNPRISKDDLFLNIFNGKRYTNISDMVEVDPDDSNNYANWALPDSTYFYFYSEEDPYDALAPIWIRNNKVAFYKNNDKSDPTLNDMKIRFWHYDENGNKVRWGLDDLKERGVWREGTILP